MSETASISMGVASRYAKAIFDLVLESNEVAKLETDVKIRRGILLGGYSWSRILRSLQADKMI